MVNAPARLILFFSSYAPLALIFIVLYVGTNTLVAVCAAGVLITGLVGLWWVLSRAKADACPEPGVVIGYRQRGDEVMGYVATYLIPFVGFSLTGLRQGVALGVFLVVLGFLYTTTDMIHINPTLHFARYRVYEVTFEHDVVKRVITRRTLRRGDQLQLVSLSDDLYIEREAP